MNKQKKSPWKALLFALFLGGLGALGGYYGTSFLKSFLPQAASPHGFVEKIGFVAVAFFAIWVTIAIHELGHLCAGLAQGFRVALYIAGFLGVRGTKHGVRFFVNRQVSLMGGLAATFPERMESGPELRRKFARIVAAGPLASLLLSVVALSALTFVRQNLGESPSLIARMSIAFLLFTSGISGVIFLATMIPTVAGGFMSDGARLLSLLNGGERGRYEEATLAVTALLGAGKLPGEYPTDLRERLMTRTPDSLLGLNGHFINFSCHLDRGETEQALPLAHLIQENISAVPSAFQGHYLKDVAFFYAFLSQDAEAAHACWNTIQKSSEKDPDAATFRVKAALALLDGTATEAIGFVEKGLAKIADLPFDGQRRFEEKWLRAVLKRAQAGMASNHQI